MVLWHEAHRRRTYHKVLDTTDEYPQGRNSCLVLIWKSKFSGSVNFKFQRLCNGELAIASILDQLLEPVHIYRMLWRRCFIKDQYWPQYIYACLFLEDCGWCFAIKYKTYLESKTKAFLHKYVNTVQIFSKIDGEMNLLKKKIDT